MSIRPIDMQTILPKAQEHRQNKELTIKQSENSQQTLNIKNQATTEHKMKQVNRTENQQSIRIKEDDARKKKENENKRQSNDARQSNEVQEADHNALLTEEEIRRKQLEEASEQLKKVRGLRYQRFDMKV